MKTAYNGTETPYNALIVYCKYIMYNVQDNSVPDNNGVCPMICEGYHFTHMWNALA